MVINLKQLLRLLYFQFWHNTIRLYASIKKIGFELSVKVSETIKTLGAITPVSAVFAHKQFKFFSNILNTFSISLIGCFGISKFFFLQILFR
jgi:hypothetical protein